MLNEWLWRCGTGLAISALAGAVLLLLSAPAQANWLARGSAVLGVGYSLKKNLGEGVDLVGEALDAAVRGDVERVRQIGSEIEALPGRLVRDAFPVFKLGAAARDAVGATGEKLQSLKDSLPRLGAGALSNMTSFRKKLPSVVLKLRRFYGEDDDDAVDPSLALAIEEEERNLHESYMKVLDQQAHAAYVAAVARVEEEDETAEPAEWSDEGGAQDEAVATGTAVQGSDPWSPDEGDAPESPWDVDTATSAAEVVPIEEEDDPEGLAFEPGGGDEYAAALNELLGDDEIAGARESSNDVQVRQTQSTIVAQQSDSGSTISAAASLCENAQRRAETANAQIDTRAKSIPSGGAEDICAQINRFDVIIRLHQECLRDPSFSATEKNAMETQLPHLEKGRSWLKDTFDGVAESWVSCECWTEMC